jgi:hypothetical protein
VRRRRLTRAFACLAFPTLVVAGGCHSSEPGVGFTADSGSPDVVDATSGDGQIFGTDSMAKEAGLTEASLVSDGSPDVEAACLDAGDAGPPPYPQRCVTPTDNECAGPTDQALTALGVPASLLNGTTGNGFDDDCDGFVDEGCTCTSSGATEDCYLVPATQVDPATRAPVGWCTTNSLGSMACAGTEFPTWSGVCRGAQPPYAHDVCAQGDFNCDGVQENSDLVNCSCSANVVTCPTTTIIEQPYPDPTNIPLIDGSQWIKGANEQAASTDWSWTVIGGDCDNVLPNPTFAIYASPDATTGMRIGARTPVVFDGAATPARYVAMQSGTIASVQAAQVGNGVAAAQVYPAFGLSGDYVVQGEWDLGGQHYVCTQKVQVRAPGIRAELCWDTVGGEELVNPAGNDLDLHLSRLQGVTCPTKGWDTTCPQGQTYEDCFWNASSGCRDYSTAGPGWGYADSPATACLGWSSERHPVDGQFYFEGCTNPRLDRDNIVCDKTILDPSEVGAMEGMGGFCASENINLDNPNDGDSFAVAVNHYGNHGGTSFAHAHVNLYCNGERVLSAGYDPVAQTTNPLLTIPGADMTGDYWEVGTITVHAGDAGEIACDVATVPSNHADQLRDGVTSPTTAGNQLCVDSTMSQANPPYDYTSHAFLEHQPLQGGTDGGIPGSAPGFCKH